VTATFIPVEHCWVCGADQFAPLHSAVFELSEYAKQDPPLSEYSGATVEIV